MTIWKTVATERLRLADEMEHFTAEQWAAASQCRAWTVQEVAAHLVMPFEVSTPRFIFTFLKHRRDLSKTAIELTEQVHRANSADELIAKLRANADNRWTPPRLGPEIPLSEIVVHGQDIRRPLGLDHKIPAETIELALTGISDTEIRADYANRVGVGVPST